MAGKLGMGLLETLLENLDRDLNLADTTLTNPTITTNAVATFSSGILNSNVTEQSGTGAEDLTSTASNLVWYANTAQATAITLPQATSSNAGMVIKIIVGTTDWSATAFKLGFANGGSTVLTGKIYLGALDGSEAVDAFKITANAKSLEIDSNDATAAGGAIGSHYEFTYLEENLVHCTAYGMCTTGTPALDANASTTTGTS